MTVIQNKRWILLAPSCMGKSTFIRSDFCKEITGYNHEMIGINDSIKGIYTLNYEFPLDEYNYANRRSFIEWFKEDFEYKKDGKKNPPIGYVEGNYKDGKKEGLFTEWYEGGQKKWEMNFKDDKNEGIETHWYENGQKKEEGNYKDGKKEGLWTEWFESGKKNWERSFKDGKVVENIHPLYGEMSNIHLLVLFLNSKKIMLERITKRKHREKEKRIINYLSDMWDLSDEYIKLITFIEKYNLSYTLIDCSDREYKIVQKDKIESI